MAMFQWGQITEHLTVYCNNSIYLFVNRAIRECDLVMPGEGRAVARELGVEYYETSVLSYYGVPEVFDNVVRAALVSRRHQRFWMTNLKRVQRPMVQVKISGNEFYFRES